MLSVDTSWLPVCVSHAEPANITSSLAEKNGGNTREASSKGNVFPNLKHDLACHDCVLGDPVTSVGDLPLLWVPGEGNC